METDRYRAKLTQRKQRISNLINAIENKLLNYPEGKLRIHQYKRTTSYYMVDERRNDTGTLLTENDRKLCMDLAQRAYLQKVLRAANDEQKLIEQFLRRFPSPSVEEVYKTLPEPRRKLITPVILPDDEYIEQWISQPYVPLGFEPGDPYYETLNGERVRSKTETMIADRLRERHIPYKYECPLIIGNKTFYPDFTILRMSDRAELYYEHLGKMGDPDYARRNINKLNKYALNGIVQGDKLFTTMESADCPFDIRTLDKLIDINFI